MSAMLAFVLTGCDSKAAVSSTLPSTTVPSARPADVREISVEIFPEGTVPGPVTSDSAEGKAVIAALPDPLPPSTDTSPSCTDASGARLTIRLANGTSLVYGPCAFPPSLQAATDVLFHH